MSDEPKERLEFQMTEQELDRLRALKLAVENTTGVEKLDAQDAVVYFWAELSGSYRFNTFTVVHPIEDQPETFFTAEEP